MKPLENNHIAVLRVDNSCRPPAAGRTCQPKSLPLLSFQILCAAMETNKILLNIDNSRMTADDFRAK